ncbi:MAG: cation:proton antiporter [Bdellovibrionales bacterium]|nr:cation:proton antiporter [Bdellovibrionales bacterium]
MRKVIILAILFSMSFALQAFGFYTNTQDNVLLAIGFVILCAYTLSEIGNSLKLPRVTGYILTGLLLGPFALNILSGKVVDEIKMINTLAIGLIAITAGLELHFSSLKKVFLPILTTTTLKIITLALSVSACFYLIDQFYMSFNLAGPMALGATALIFAALSLGTSPAISLAVISESKAKGRLSQLVLGSAIVKDVVVVVFLAIVLSFAKSVFSNEGGGEEFSHLMVELGYSLVAGAILGSIFIFYIRFIQQEMFLFISVMILATAEVSKAVHLELLLVFIVAGIFIRNFSKAEHVLHEALERVSLPVFVVFFTNVGAGLNLQATWQYLPVALSLFAARSLSFFISSKMACRFHSEKPVIEKNVWLGYLPQAGVTLGLIAIAAKDLPEQADLITNLGIAVVTLNLLIGPITLRWALKNAKEISGLSEEERGETHSFEETRQTFETEKPSKPIDHFAEDFIEDLSHKIDDPWLKDHFAYIGEEFFQIFKKHQLLPQKNILKGFTDDLSNFEGMSENEIVDELDEHFSRMGEKGREIYHSIPLFQEAIDKIQIAHTLPLQKRAIWPRRKDPWLVLIVKVLKLPVMVFIRKPERTIPLRKVAKYNLEPFAAQFSLQMIHSWFRLLGRHIDTFQTGLENHSLNSEEIFKQISEDNEHWFLTANSDFILEFKKVCRDWIEQLNNINTSYLSESRVRYSHVEPEIKEAFDQAKRSSMEWEEKFIFCRNRLKVVVRTALLTSAMETMLEEKFFTPIQEAQKNADQLVQDVYRHFDDIEAQLKATSDPDFGFFKNLYRQTTDFTQSHLQAELKSKYIRGSFRLLNRDITMNLKRSLPKEEGSFQITSELTPPHQVKSPTEIMVKKINIYELFEQSILINFLPIIEEKIEGVSNYLESLLMEMEQAFSILHYAFESQLTLEESYNAQELTESIHNILVTEKEKISELYTGMVEYIMQAKSTAEKLNEESQNDVKQGIERFSVVATAKNQFRQRLQHIGHSIVDKKEAWKTRIRQAYQKVKSLTRNQREREIDRLLHLKMQSKTLDTTTIRQYIDESYSMEKDLENLPRVYFRLFTLDPIQDKRFFIAHLSRWKHFENFAKENGFRESQKWLVLGDRGIGKSSLLNIAQMDIHSERLIRIDESPHRNLTFTLSKMLGCRNTHMGIINALKNQSTTIIVDNVDQWLSKSKLANFVEFLELVKQSPSQCHWLLSMTNTNFDGFDRAFKMRSIFNKIIDLNTTHPEVCKEVILSRHRLSGLKLVYPKTFVSDWALKFGFASEDEMFFRVLFERSGGHLRHMIYLWLMSMKKTDGKTIELSLHKGMDRGLPMIGELSLLQKYILSELYSYHRANLSLLSHDLGVSRSVMDNEVQYLEHAGLIVSRGIDRSLVEIPLHLAYMVGKELKKEGIIRAEPNQPRH